MCKIGVSICLILMVWASGICGDVKLMDFEEAAVVAKAAERAAEVDGPAGKALTFEHNNLWATSGDRSLALNFVPFKKGLREWPGLSCRYKWRDYTIKDWSKYGEFAFDVHNPTGYTIRLCVELRSDVSTNGNTTVFEIAPGSQETIKINLERVSKNTSRPVNLKSVEQIIFYCTRPPEPWRIYIDNVRLLDNRKQLLCLYAYRRACMLNEYLYDSKLKAEYSDKLARVKQEIYSDKGRSAFDLAVAADEITGRIKNMLYKPPFLFNFGSDKSGVCGDWRNAGIAEYSAERKSGWNETGSLKVFRKSFGSDWRDGGNYFTVNRPPEMYLDPEQEGLVSSYADAEFRVDLPDGAYRVMAIAGYPGDPGMCPVDMTVALNGVEHRVTLADRYIYKIPVWRTEVSGGKLQIRFKSNNSRQWLINALAVWPESENAKADTEFLNRLKDHIYILPERLRAEWIDARRKCGARKNINPELFPSAIALFGTGQTTDYTYDYTPESYGLPGGLKLISARNEIAAAWFGAIALPGAGDTLNVVISGLEGPVKIPASDIKVNMVVNVPWPEHKGTGPRYSVGKIVRMPRLLERPDEGGFQWRNWQARQLYLTVRPPVGGFKAGIYRGALRLQSGKGKTVKIPLELNVMPIELKTDPEMSYGAYWYWYRDKTEARARAEMRDMREHGFNMLGPVPLSMWPELENGKVTVKMPNKPAPAIILGREYGFDRPAPYQMEGYLRALSKVLYGKYVFKKSGVGGENLPDSFYPHMTDAVKQVLAWLKKHNLGEVYFYPVDEVFNLKFATRLLEACREAPGAKTFCNFNPLIQQELGGLIDVSCYPYTMYMNELGLKRLVAASSGRMVWTYDCPGSYGGTRAETRLCWGLSGSRIGLRGFWPWAYCAPQGNPYSAFDGAWIDPMLVYPGLEPLSTVQYEAIRQGIDDVRYLYSLKTLIADAQNSGNDKRREVAENARRELDRAMNEVPCLFRSDAAAEWARKRLADLRAMMARNILKLQEAANN